MQTLIVKDIIGGTQGLTLEDGEKLYKQLHPIIVSGDKVVLDFGGMSEMTTAFFNNAVGRLYADFESSILQTSIDVANISTSAARSLNRSLNNARNYYAHKHGA